MGKSPIATRVDYMYSVIVSAWSGWRPRSSRTAFLPESAATTTGAIASQLLINHPSHLKPLIAACSAVFTEAQSSDDNARNSSRPYAAHKVSLQPPVASCKFKYFHHSTFLLLSNFSSLLHSFDAPSIRNISCPQLHGWIPPSGLVYPLHQAHSLSSFPSYLYALLPISYSLRRRCTESTLEICAHD